MLKSSGCNCRHFLRLVLQQNPGWFDILVPAYPGCHGNRPLKRLLLCCLCCESRLPSFGTDTGNHVAEF